MTRSVELLRADHDVSAFDCGTPALNLWLQRFSLQNQSAGSARTYVGLAESAVIGFYSLTAGQVEHAHAPDRVRKGLARHPVPVLLLARLAVDRSWQGKGAGSALLRDALLRTAMAAEIAGIRALLVHAKDERAREFYERFDFTPSPTDPLHLYLLLKDLRAALQPNER